MSLKKGQEAEERASCYLRDAGYEILARNFHSKFGEIDIVAHKEGVTHFCEVKYSTRHDPIWQITPQKMAKILQTIRFYCMRFPKTQNYQVDAILVRPDGIEMLKNISY